MGLAFGLYDIRKVELWGAIIANPEALNKKDKCGCSLAYYWYQIEPAILKKLLETIWSEDEKPDFKLNIDIEPVAKGPWHSSSFIYLIAIKQDFDFFFSYLLNNVLNNFALLNERIQSFEHPYAVWTLADLFIKSEAILPGSNTKLPATDSGLILLNALLKEIKGKKDFSLSSKLNDIQPIKLIELQLWDLFFEYIDKNPKILYQKIEGTDTDLIRYLAINKHFNIVEKLINKYSYDSSDLEEKNLGEILANRENAFQSDIIAKPSLAEIGAFAHKGKRRHSQIGELADDEENKESYPNGDTKKVFCKHG